MSDAAMFREEIDSLVKQENALKTMVDETIKLVDKPPNGFDAGLVESAKKDLMEHRIELEELRKRTAKLIGLLKEFEKVQVIRHGAH